MSSLGRSAGKRLNSSRSAETSGHPLLGAEPVAADPNAKAGPAQTVEGSAAGSKTYTVSYTPRHAPSRPFQSHASQIAAATAAAASATSSGPSSAQGTSALHAGPTLSTSADAALSSHAPLAPGSNSTVKLHLQQLKGSAQELGLGLDSAGWMMLERLQAAVDGEWAELAELVSSGRATLLLPQEPLGSPDLALSVPYDHILLSAEAIKPPSGSSSLSIVSLSGLRGTIDENQLTIKSFVPREDLIFVSELRDPSSRSTVLDALAPLPSSNSFFPKFRLASFKDDFALPPAPRPPPLPPRPDLSRASSSSRSPSLATLFAGTRKGRTRSLASPDQGAQSGTESTTSGGDLYVSNSGSPTPWSEQSAEHHSEGGQETKISVWVCDRILRKAKVLEDLGAAVGTRVERRLEGLPEGAIVRARQFLSRFFPIRSTWRRPPAAANADAAEDLTASTATITPSSFGNVHLLGPPLYQSVPEDISGGLQDFLSDVRACLEDDLPVVWAATGSSHELCDDDEFEVLVDAAVEKIESVVCSEVYDRLFCPFTSRDAFHDDALASRIAAFNVLGLALSHLGVVVPEGDTEEGRDTADKLAKLVSACGEELQRLQEPRCRSPADKLSVLVAAHRIIVDGLSEMPNVELRQDDAKNRPTDDEMDETPSIHLPRDAEVELNENEVSAATRSNEDNLLQVPAAEEDGEETPRVQSFAETKARESRTPAPSAGAIPEEDASSPPKEVAQSEAPAERKTATSSADLILPVLIFSVVTSNPHQLASNLLFIQRFRCESLVRGETSFCLVNTQAVVEFLEKVDMPTLGLSSDRVLSFQDKSPVATRHSTSVNFNLAGADVITASMPERIRGRFTQEIGDLADYSNRVLSGVMASSVSAFGRFLGSSNADEAVEQPRTIEDVRNVLSGGASRLAPSSLMRRTSFGGLSITSKGRAEEEEEERAHRELQEVASERDGGGGADESDARSVRSLTSILSGVSGKEGERKEEQRPAEKLSIGGRLAALPVLSRFSLGDKESRDKERGRELVASVPNLGVSPPASGPQAGAGGSVGSSKVGRREGRDDMLNAPSGFQSGTPFFSFTAKRASLLGSSASIKSDRSSSSPGASTVPLPVPATSTSALSAGGSTTFAPPIQRFLECSEEELRLGEVARLLADYRRLADALKALGAFHEESVVPE